VVCKRKEGCLSSRLFQFKRGKPQLTTKVNDAPVSSEPGLPPRLHGACAAPHPGQRPRCHLKNHVLVCCATYVYGVVHGGCQRKRTDAREAILMGANTKQKEIRSL
jgi:hypothetical protein